MRRSRCIKTEIKLIFRTYMVIPVVGFCKNSQVVNACFQNNLLRRRRTAIHGGHGGPFQTAAKRGASHHNPTKPGTRARE